MSPQDRENLVGDLKEKGQKLYDQYVPQEVKDMIKQKTGMGSQSGTQSGTASANSHFGEGNSYSS